MTFRRLLAHSGLRSLPLLVRVYEFAHIVRVALVLKWGRR